MTNKTELNDSVDVEDKRVINLYKSLIILAMYAYLYLLIRMRMCVCLCVGRERKREHYVEGFVCIFVRFIYVCERERGKN